jgi:hypothetical protein
MSRTDPDAGLVAPQGGARRPRTTRCTSAWTAAGQRIVTAIDATPGEVLDEDLLVRLVEEHEGATGRTVAEVVADSQYGTHEHYRWLEARGIRPSSSPHLGAGKQRAVPGEVFAYGAVADRFVCPEGQVLHRQGRPSTARPGGGVIYRASPATCTACPIHPVGRRAAGTPKPAPLPVRMTPASMPVLGRTRELRMPGGASASGDAGPRP